MNDYEMSMITIITILSIGDLFQMPDSNKVERLIGPLDQPGALIQ